MNSTQLDRFLREWAERTAIDAGHATALAERLRQGAARAGAAPATLWTGSAPPALRRRPVGYVLAGAAAVLLVQFVLWPLLSERRAAALPPATALADGQPARRAAVLFREASALFPQRLRWVAETDAGVHVEVSPDEFHGVVAGDTLVVRLVALVREAGMPWRTAWTATVATTGEDMVQLDLSEHGRISLWARCLEPRLAVAELDLDLRQPALAIAATRLVRLDLPEELLRLEAAATEYRVYQTVTLANGQVRPPQT